MSKPDINKLLEEKGYELKAFRRMPVRVYQKGEGPEVLVIEHPNITAVYKISDVVEL